VLVVERNFAEFSGEIARDYFGKRHDPGLRGRERWWKRLPTADLDLRAYSSRSTTSWTYRGIYKTFSLFLHQLHDSHHSFIYNYLVLFADMESTGFLSHIWICVEDNNNSMWSFREEIQVLHKRVGLCYADIGKNPCRPVRVHIKKYD
jgi:hypothetical protein